MSQGRRSIFRPPPTTPDLPTTRGRGPTRKWKPDAVVVVRATNEEAADTLCMILTDALASHPEKMHVLFEIDSRPLTNEEAEAKAIIASRSPILK